MRNHESVSDGLLTTRKERQGIFDVGRLSEPDPPNFLNGIPCLLTRSPDRKSVHSTGTTGDFLKGTPSSRNSSIRCATKRDCSFHRERHTTGFSSGDVRKSRFLKLSFTSSMIAFATFRIGCVLR